MCSAFGRLGPRVTAALVASVLLVGPVAAQQDGCATGFGQFITSLTGFSVSAASGLLAAFFLVGMVLRVLPFQGTDHLGNAALAAFFIALIVGVAGFSIYDMAAQYMPIGLDQTCGGITGGGGGG